MARAIYRNLGDEKCGICGKQLIYARHRVDNASQHGTRYRVLCTRCMDSMLIFVPGEGKNLEEDIDQIITRYRRHEAVLKKKEDPHERQT